MPAKDAAGSRNPAERVADVRGVKFVRQEHGAAVFEVESGAYSLHAAL